MSGIAKIKAIYDSLTSTEKKIANYILNHRSNVLYHSSQQLGQATDTSPSSWVRFAKKLGYTGLPAFKVDLAKDDNHSEYLYHTLIDESDSTEQLIQKSKLLSSDVFNQTYQLLNPTTLQTVIDRIIESPTVYLIGAGGSGIICSDFMHKLTRIDKNVVYHEDTEILLTRIAHVKPKDSLIAVSYSGETESVNLAVKYAKERGVPITAITCSNPNSTLAKLADCNLFIPTKESEIRLGSIFSRNSSLVVTDLLYLGVAKSNLEETEQSLIKTKNIVSQK